MPLSEWRMSSVLPGDIPTNHRVSGKPGPKINDKHDKDKLEYVEVRMCEATPNILELNKKKTRIPVCSPVVQFYK